MIKEELKGMYGGRIESSDSSRSGLVGDVVDICPEMIQENPGTHTTGKPSRHNNPFHYIYLFKLFIVR